MKMFERKYPKPEAAPGLMSECPLADWYGKEGVWRTALEWLKKISKDGHTLDMCGIEDIIEEELEDK